MKTMRWMMVASTISYLAYADRVEIDNKTDYPVEVGIIYTEGHNTIPQMVPGSLADVQIIDAKKTGSINRPGLKFGKDRYLVARMVVPESQFTKDFKNLKNGMQWAASNSAALTWLSRRDKYREEGFTFEPVGYLQGSSFTIRKHVGNDWDIYFQS